MDSEQQDGAMAAATAATADEQTPEEIEREAASRRERQFRYDLARLIDANRAKLRYDGQPILGAWAHESALVVQLSTKKMFSFGTYEQDAYTWTIMSAIEEQARANGHKPTPFEYTTFGRVSHCERCGVTVSVADDNTPHVEPYSATCRGRK